MQPSNFPSKKTNSKSLSFLAVQVQLIDGKCVCRKLLLLDFEANCLLNMKMWSYYVFLHYAGNF